ncbi:hypothetical protein COP1_010950 [Malus domestica]
MALRSNGRNLSFEILSRNSSLDDQHDHAIFHRSNSDPVQSDQATNSKFARRKRKKKKKTPATAHASIPESPTAIYGVVSNSFDVISETTNRETGDIHGNGLEFNYSVQTVLLPVTTEVVDPEFQGLHGTAELRQRTVIGSGGGVVEETETASSRIESQAKEESAAEGGLASKQRSELSGNVIPKLQTAESLDWKRLMAEDPNHLFSVDKSPVQYFMEEMSNGNALRSTTTLGNEKERERVYDTIFRLPWRCELLIDVGFFVCFDSFLSLLTIMPTRILMTIWRTIQSRQFKRPSAAELCDFGCFTIWLAESLSWSKQISA